MTPNDYGVCPFSKKDCSPDCALFVKEDDRHGRYYEACVFIRTKDMIEDIRDNTIPSDHFNPAMADAFVKAGKKYMKNIRKVVVA